MNGTTVDISTRDGVADAYLSEPPGGDGNRPGVLFIMDAFGLRPRIEEMADRIAAHGFVVLAPNVLYRAGRSPLMEMPDLEDPAQRDPFFARLGPAMAELTPERIESDGGAYLDYLATVARAPFAITGYCMGGRVGGGSPPRTPTGSRRSRASTRAASLPRTRTARTSAPARSPPSSTSAMRTTTAALPGEPGRARAITRRGGGALPVRAVRGRRTRLHHERHGGLQRGGGRTALHRAAGAARTGCSSTEADQAGPGAAVGWRPRRQTMRTRPARLRRVQLRL